MDAMPERQLHWETRGKVTTLKLDRTSALNALGEDMAAQFKKALAAISKEGSSVLILTGTGPAFSAGGDLAFIEANTKRPRAKLPALMRSFYGSFLAVRGLPQVTIASVNGAAVGAGLCLALACDLRAVLACARLSLNFVRLGLNPGMAAWPLARAAFGDARARDLLFTGRSFLGRDLHAWGAASAVAESAAELEEKTRALAQEIAGHSASSLRLLKAETRLRGPLEDYLAFEARGQAESFKGPDILEGLAAVRLRRAPKF